jgi:TonB family protein
MVMAALPTNRREPAFTGFQPPPSHPLRRLLLSDGPAPLAAEGFADPAPGDAREPKLDLFPPALPQSRGREPLYRRAPVLRQWRGSFSSLALHALVIALILIDWQAMPPPEAPPIPVQLVVEPPPKPKPKAPAQPVHHPHGLLASEEMGNTAKAGPQQVKAPESTAAPAAPPTPPAPPTPALITPPPSTAPSLPLDLPKVADALAAPLPGPKPKPAPPPRPPAKVESRPAAMSLHQAKVPGPAASRDEYLAYAFSLVKRHFYLLPRSVIGERRGEAVVGFVVHDDGRVSELEVEQSSGYTDIDRKAEEMIIAVGRFPPLPQWFQGEAIRLEFHLEFPTAME